MSLIARSPKNNRANNIFKCVSERKRKNEKVAEYYNYIIY